VRSSLLLDTGPLVAYLRPREADHDWAVEQFEALDEPFVSCEPVLTEACFLVMRAGRPATVVLDLLRRGLVRVGFELADELIAVRELMARYRNIPMSLADACLVRLAELTRLPVCTLDSDFMIYRLSNGRPLALIMPVRQSLHEP
jgi:predicted nucleic acid-binding protein